MIVEDKVDRYQSMVRLARELEREAKIEGADLNDDEDYKMLIAERKKLALVIRDEFNGHWVGEKAAKSYTDSPAPPRPVGPVRCPRGIERIVVWDGEKYVCNKPIDPDERVLTLTEQEDIQKSKEPGGEEDADDEWQKTKKNLFYCLSCEYNFNNGGSPKIPDSG